MPLNDANFLMWFDEAEDPFAWEIPRPFVREPEVLSPVVWLLPGERTHIYINTVDNTPIQYNDGVGIIIYDEKGTPTLLETALYLAEFPGGSHLYGSFVTPGGAKQGLCRLKLGNKLTQWLWVCSPEQAQQFTVLAKFRNSRRLQNIRYAYLPDDFYQQIRIRLANRGEEPAHDKEVYTEASTGKRRHYYSEPNLVTTFITPEYSRWAHRAMASLLEHDTLLLNGRKYSYDGGYKANMTEADELSTGEFTVRDESYSTLHRA
ncbi:hypothetical protein [Tellurirhabdus bombi]|uniref:hypothetical protein n=1 Tax=Tellurirhabdus bombi TaxID=2907205 RepID=UPI001F190624|nr:hypothetical protein [Tellurirhabdus bombi]